MKNLLLSEQEQVKVVVSRLFTIILEVLASAIRQAKEWKKDSEKEEKKPPVFADDMIVHIENPKESTEKLLELMSLASYRIQGQIFKS